MFRDRVLCSYRQCLRIRLCLVIGLRLEIGICYNLNCSLLKHIVALTIIS